MSHLPIIGVTACSRQIGQHAVQINDTKYLQAVCAAAKGLPVIFCQSLRTGLTPPRSFTIWMDCCLPAHRQISNRIFTAGRPVRRKCRSIPPAINWRCRSGVRPLRLACQYWEFAAVCRK